MTLSEALALECSVWDALVAGDAAADEAALAPDFLGVYPSGFAERGCHVGQLDDGPSVARYRIEDARLDVIADDAFLIAYHAVFARGAEQSAEETMYVSSLWRFRDERWVNTFSQDTPAA